MTPTTRQPGPQAMAVMLPLLLLLGSARAASDGWTPIIPEGGRHALAVEPGLPGPSSLAGSLASSLASLASLGGGSSYHSHVDHHVSFRPGPPGPPGPPPRPLTLHMPLPSALPSALPDFGLHAAHGAHGDHADTCALYKAAMTQDLYFQYIQYKVHMPDLKEFTLCMWHKFYNHSSDHPLFSYATRETSRAILSWVSATDRSTYFSMSVDGHTLYRLNYPLRLNRWYHSCQSWNGRTGEWQVWINAERVGRGFHNLLVNHVIKGGGVAITGQEQRQYGGGFIEGEGAPKGAGGMLGEITQLQMYTVALTAGKAYRDHKHHHGNYNGAPENPRSTTTPPPPPPMPETSTANPYAPFITNGQLTPQLPIFELSAFRKNIPMPPMDDAQGGQAAASAAQPSAPAMLDLSQLLAAAAPASGPAVSYLHMSPGPGGATVRIPLLTHAPARPALDLDPQQHYLFKRDDAASGQPAEAGEAGEAAKQETPVDAEPAASTKVKRSAEDDADKAAAQVTEMEPQKLAAKPARPARPAKRDTKRGKARKQAVAATPTEAAPVTQAHVEADVKPSSPTKRELDPAESEQQVKQADTKQKRQTISLHGGPVDLGGELDTSLLGQGLSGLLPHGELLGAGLPSAPSPSPSSLFLELGGHPQLLQPRPAHGSPKPPPLKKESEPAEGEVMAVMAMCSGCASDPFAKVNIISWQGTPKKLYSGVHYLPAKPVCRKF